MQTKKYNLTMTDDVYNQIIGRLTNQLWKLIPMREHDENWSNQLSTVILEIVGLNELINLNHNFFKLLTKLEGLNVYPTEFDIYRKTVFETISLLRELI